MNKEEIMKMLPYTMFTKGLYSNSTRYTYELNGAESYFYRDKIHGEFHIGIRRYGKERDIAFRLSLMNPSPYALSDIFPSGLIRYPTVTHCLDAYLTYTDCILSNQNKELQYTDLSNERAIYEKLIELLSIVETPIVFSDRLIPKDIFYDLYRILNMNNDDFTYDYIGENDDYSVIIDKYIIKIYYKNNQIGRIDIKNGRMDICKITYSNFVEKMNDFIYTSMKARGVCHA